MADQQPEGLAGNSSAFAAVGRLPGVGRQCGGKPPVNANQARRSATYSVELALSTQSGPSFAAHGNGRLLSRAVVLSDGCTTAPRPFRSLADRPMSDSTPLITCRWGKFSLNVHCTIRRTHTPDPKQSVADRI